MRMIKLFLNGFIVLMIHQINAQVGINTTSPDASAILEVVSTDSGILIPRMTTSQREGITSPATGLLVFDSTTESFWYHASSGWIDLEQQVRLDNESVLIGDLVATSLNDGAQNVLIGYQAGESITDGSATIAIGYQALQALEGSGNSFNTVVGWQSGLNTEYQFPFFGTSQAPFAGFGNSLFGARVLVSNTSGALNSAFGYQAMLANSTGSDNTSGGAFSLNKNTSGSQNVAIGFRAAQENTSGSGSTSIGFDAGFNGSNNQFCTYIGHSAQNSSALLSYTNSTAIGYQASITADNQVRIGNTSVTDIGGYAAWSNLSDGRYKHNIQENIPGLDFILNLRPISYQVDIALGKNNTPQIANKIESGFIAQEVEVLANEIGYDFNGLITPKNKNDHYKIAYSQFVVPLTKALQEQNAIIESQKEKVETLEKRLKKIEMYLETVSENELISKTE